MRWSATRARWVLLGGAVLLMAVLAAFFGLARYRAGKVWQRILARNGVHVTRESNGITWSQSSKGRTIFTVHAAKAVPQGPNKWLLHDAVLILYGRQPGHDDRIYGSEFQYDETEGVARALGEVHLDLQLPEAGGKAPAAGAQPALEFGTEPTDDPGMIHVRTSGLVYMRKLGLAATGEPAEFRFRGLTCTSRGAEFDTDHSVVRLLADVRLSGELRQAPFSLAASRATLDRNANSADLETPFLVSGDRSARAQHTVLHLRKDGSLEGAEADGAVQMRTGTQTLEAPLLKANFGPQSVPEQAQLSTGVAFTDRSATAPAQGSAKTLDLLWTAGGTLQQATANGSVSFLERAVRNGAETGTRQMRAEQAVALFVPASAKRVELSKLHLVGGAEIRSVGASDPAGGDGTPSLLRVAGDALTAAFAGGVTGRPLVQTLTGEGHTHLEQTAADGARQTSTGDKLEMSFAPAPLNGPRGAGMAVSSAVQTGHVEIVSFPAASPAKAGASTSAPTTARADRALYAASAGTVTLTGEQGRKPNLRSAGTEVEANTLVLHQGTGDAEMEEGVVATDPGEGDAPATHILARRANLLHDAGLAEFLGDESRAAQLFQGGSQVQAAKITLDNAHRRLSARPAAPGGVVHATFAAAGATPAAIGQADRRTAASAPAKEDASLGRPGGSGVAAPKLPEAERSHLAVTAATMDFDDLAREATFSGDVHLTGATGSVVADRGVALLSPAPGTAAPAGGVRGAEPALGGTLQRMVLQGNVHLRQPGRTGEGEQMVYTAATGNFVLTGTPAKPPRITGEQGALVTGATLLFRSEDNTVVVAGASGNGKGGTGKEAGPARAHTERDLKR